MAVTEQQVVPSAETAPQPARPSRQRAFSWPTPAQLRRSAPIFTLLAEIWAIPEVGKVGIANDEDGVEIRVLIREENRPARSAIYAAERDYLNATPPHSFRLWVSSAAKVGDVVLAPFEIVLER